LSFLTTLLFSCQEIEFNIEASGKFVSREALTFSYNKSWLDCKVVDGWKLRISHEEPKNNCRVLTLKLIYSTT
jgi:hypothetical protein